ncbi:energy transducer TonB [Colwellia sp. D2M02]|nr:energy transducer TonB [Colwellia sp. D2M02]
MMTSALNSTKTALKAITQRKPNRFHFVAFIASSVLMIMALLGILASNWFANEYEPKVMVRKVNQAFTPPPPPPPPVNRQTSEAQPTIDLSAAGEGPSLAIADIKIKQNFDPMLSPPEMNHSANDFELDLAVDWQAFGLGELDSIPVLLTQIKTAFPRSLARKGIKKAKVALDVFIDEQGSITLVGIKEMPYEELSDAINKIIRDSRFSVPTKNGQAVRARFIWPVEFKKT